MSCPKSTPPLARCQGGAHCPPNVFYDSQRVKNLTDAQIEHELRRIAPMLKALKNLLFVGKKRQVVVVKQTHPFDI